ncbi:Electron transfer flavoprotein alpha/beta-subunit [Desulfotomaculum nigrificans CO-1-SRB]|uniref:Electron transfer flavoprotein small subunit n=1 Tax=Desulfotomaculum nigrificans (strain DSM 14880 / VKM B-2319 / CO-1-SRB) TaxID=868595 RepID=F6B2V4_DESCC|nr:electron transfer flavoprotein subunit beta/FixA family protein [Desulfotomaculum nigrificans]AEF95062.1 Electron transfer flavoprotein alpha/beta-subunit [Desulfotomaculum nigrificans CO-1-SRB]
MNIVVLIKQVPGTDNVKMDPETGVMIRSGKDTIINPLDENALAEAVRIKNSRDDVKLTAISMGPESAMKALKEAVAMGADAGVLLSGRAFAGSDTIATAKALAAAIKKLGPVDLVICGERATDGETGQTGAMIANNLDIPVQTYVSALEVKEDGVVVKRTVEGGFERVEVPFPVLVTVNKDINEPGFPTLNGKLRAKQVTIPVWGPEELGVDKSELGLGGSPTRVVKVFSPKLSRDTIMKKADGSTKPVDELIKFLTEKEAL